MRPGTGMLLLVLAGLAACERQADFDENYEAQSRALTDRANAMEQELQQQMNAARSARTVEGAGDSVRP